MKRILTHSFSLVVHAMLVTAFLWFCGAVLFNTRAPLLPKSDTALGWHQSIVPEAVVNGTSNKLLSVTDNIEYEFQLSLAQQYPYASFNFDFRDKHGKRVLRDLSSFDDLSFEVTCTPRNILLLVLFTYDQAATDLNNPETYRVNWHFFTCNDTWHKEKAPLRDFDTPDWWLQSSGLELIEQAYELEKVIGFAVVNTLQSPRGIKSRVKLVEVELSGTNWLAFGTALVLIAGVWGGLIFVLLTRFIEQKVEVAKARLKEDLPLMAYQKLSIDSQKDKEKSKLLIYLASDYANPELNTELVVQTLGINRNKINEILRAELGLTFSAYINKLRLTEAGRLLSVHKDETISQIAYRVGYNNVTYFNKLFKETYGCTPKRFKDSVDDKN